MLSKCPKCKYSQPKQQKICSQCGIVFEKYYKHHSSRASDIEYRQKLIQKKQKDHNETIVPQIVELVLPNPTIRPFFITRAMVYVFFMVWGARLMSTSIASNAVGTSFMHMINLPFHEAGHIIFSPFGAFITSLGGTLAQLLMPSICTLTLLIKHQDQFGASITLWWVAENFLDIAPYINDARSGVLPLLGGNFGHSAPYGFHDWEFILTESGLLRYDHQIACIAFAMGCILMFVSYLWTGSLLYREFQLRKSS